MCACVGVCMCLCVFYIQEHKHLFINPPICIHLLFDLPLHPPILPSILQSFDSAVIQSLNSSINSHHSIRTLSPFPRMSRHPFQLIQPSSRQSLTGQLAHIFRLRPLSHSFIPASNGLNEVSPMSFMAADTLLLLKSTWLPMFCGFLLSCLSLCFCRYVCSKIQKAIYIAPYALKMFVDIGWNSG